MSHSRIGHEEGQQRDCYGGLRGLSEGVVGDPGVSVFSGVFDLRGIRAFGICIFVCGTFLIYLFLTSIVMAITLLPADTTTGRQTFSIVILSMWFFVVLMLILNYLHKSARSNKHSLLWMTDSQGKGGRVQLLLEQVEMASYHFSILVVV